MYIVHSVFCIQTLWWLIRLWQISRLSMHAHSSLQITGSSEKIWIYIHIHTKCIQSLTYCTSVWTWTKASRFVFKQAVDQFNAVLQCSLLLCWPCASIYLRINTCWHYYLSLIAAWTHMRLCVYMYMCTYMQDACGASLWRSISLSIQVLVQPMYHATCWHYHI